MKTNFPKLPMKQLRLFKSNDSKKIEYLKNELARYYLDNMKINPVNIIKIGPNSYITKMENNKK